MSMILKYRKAISPVIAVILIIALTVAAGGIVWAITTGLLDSDRAEIAVEEYAVADKNGNERGDFIRFKVRNIGTSDGTINQIDLYRDGAVMTSWSLVEEISLSQGQSGIIEMETSDSQEEVNNQHKVRVSIQTNQSSTEIKIAIPSTLTALAVFFEVGDNTSGGEFTEQGLIDQGWVLHEYTSDHGTGDINVDSGDIRFDTNSDMLFYLNNTDYIVSNGILTADFLWGDDDGIGIAFRIIDEANYYWVGYTNDHNSDENRHGETASYGGPYFENDGVFELHKVENGIDTLLASNIPSFSIQSGHSWDLKGPYEFAVSFSGSQISFSAAMSSENLEEQFTITDGTFSNEGYVGVISTACEDSRLDNFFITS